jgi:hypothetical protein
MSLLRKNVTLPHLAILHAKFRGRLKIESSPLLFLFYELAVDCFANSEITRILVEVDKICVTNFVDFTHLARFPTFSCFNHPMLRTLAFGAESSPLDS